LDGAEIAQGTDPLTGILLETGLLATVALPSAPLHVCVHESLIAVACTSHLVVLSQSDLASDPKMIMVLPMSARRVLCGQSRLAVVTTTLLNVFDYATLVGAAPPFPAVVTLAPQNSVSTVPEASAVFGDLCLVHLSTFELYMINMQAAGLLQTDAVVVGGASLPRAVLGVWTLNRTNHILATAWRDQFIYVVFPSVVNTYSRAGLHLLASTPLSVGTYAAVAISNQQLLIVLSGGLERLSLANPSNPIGGPIVGPWPNNNKYKSFAATGDLLLLSTVAPVRLDVYAQANVSFITSFNVSTATSPSAVVVGNGLGYLVSNNALSVVLYRAMDTLHVPPVLTLTSSISTNVTTGSVTLLDAIATDDVQIRFVVMWITFYCIACLILSCRSVDFYINGSLAFSAVSPPFYYVYRVFSSFGVGSKIFILAR
jgi:hypothetical protein